MKGYLSPANDESRNVPLDGRAEVYRDPDRGQQIVVETGGEVRPLGVADVTVSRKKGGTPPVVFEPGAESIEVRNQGNSNGVVVDPSGTAREIEEGFSDRLRRDTRLKLGYQTELELTVEREAREEYVIQGNVDAEGDVVVGGDKTEVDRSTSMEDFVTSGDVEAGTDGSADVRDGVAAGTVDTGGASSQADTHKVCDTHGPYTGEVCPECASARAEQAGPADTEAQRERESKYCLSCGEQIPGMARVCPACGQQQSDAEDGETKYCIWCAEEIPAVAGVCPDCGEEQGG